jgi:hypothetical protein
VFATSRPFLFFDYFRVPYRIEERERPLAGACGRARVETAERDGPALYWPEPEQIPAPGEHRLDGTPLFGGVVSDEHSAAWRTALGGHWRPETEIRSTDGQTVGSIWRDERGSALLPFDPDEIMRTLWSEAYQQVGGSSGLVKRLALRGYYRARPALPRSLQIALRRAFTRVQARTSFPRWPAETALHDLYERLLGLTASVAGQPIPTIAAWPAGRSWALVLTHDVETSLGYEHIPVLCDVELAAGCRSSWNLVPKRYAVEDSVVADLRARGFEVGVHGLYHDGRDLESRELLDERLPEMRSWAERWEATGFRAPATHRNWEWMPLLGFDYDTSYPDTDPFEPQGGGCCTWLPFFNDGMVELPITLAQDHTLFVILRRDESLWREKTDFLRSRGGMALLITHPDYMLAPERVDSYRSFLDRALSDPGVWCALPSEVSAWWRRRAASRVEWNGAGWRVTGPASGEAAVALTSVPERAPSGRTPEQQQAPC